MEKNIFITGAGSGIGRATAMLFAEKGWFVGMTDINEQALNSLESELGEDGCFYSVMDVANPVSVEQAVRKFRERSGGCLHTLFNCAGVLFMGPHSSISMDNQRKTVNVNLTGILNCIHYCLGMLKQTDNTHIVNMCSASALYGTPELAVYSATKFAVKGLTEALNIEFEPLGINVSDIMVPYVETPMITGAEVRAKSVDRLGVRISPEQVAGIVWKAVHTKKVHHSVGLIMNLMIFFSWAFPFANKKTAKLLAFS